MTGSADEPAAGRAAVTRAYRAQTAAMLSGDVAALDAILADAFFATHITGAHQSKADWLRGIKSGATAYHRIKELMMTIDMTGATALVTSRALVTATIYGAHGTWPLESTTRFEHLGEEWVAAESSANLFSQRSNSRSRR